MPYDGDESGTALVLPSNLPDIARAALPATYERACTALATCDRIDECKDWADKAAALASYAKQADDQTLHRLATRISARAIRRAGELLKTFQSNGGRPSKQVGASPPVSQRHMADAAGMSKDQEVTAVRVANVPDDEFEALVESDNPPTVTALAERGTDKQPAPAGFADATRAIGLFKEFATFCSEHPAGAVAGAMYPHERHAVQARLLTIRTWLREFDDCLEGQC
jgi:hypothetical protein